MKNGSTLGLFGYKIVVSIHGIKFKFYRIVLIDTIYIYQFLNSETEKNNYHISQMISLRGLIKH